MTISGLDALPGWVPWAGPGLIVGVMALVFLVMPVGVIRFATSRVDDATPWTERARWIHVARLSALTATLVLPVIAGFLAVVLVGPLSPISRPAVVAVVSLLAIVGSIIAMRRVAETVHGDVVTVRQAAAGWMLTFAPVALFLLLGWLAPARLSSWWMIPWLLAGVGLVGLWLNMPLLLIPLGMASSGGVRVSHVVAAASREAVVEVDRIIELDSAQPNAFAAPWLSTLVFTTGMLDMTTDEELKAISHHELAHLGESAGMTRLRKAQLLVFIPIAAIKPLLNSVGLFGVLAVLIVALGLLDLARRKGAGAEALADEQAIQSSHGSVAFGRAIEKTYRLGLIPAVLRRASHGQLHERLAVAGVEVDYDIPKPPSLWPHVLGLVLAMLVVVVVILAPWAVAAFSPDDSRTPTLLAATLPLYGSDPLLSLAFDAEANGRWSEAAMLTELAVVVEPDEWVRADVARLWAAAGECELARAARDHIDPSGGFSDQRVYASSFVERCEFERSADSSG